MRMIRNAQRAATALGVGLMIAGASFASGCTLDPDEPPGALIRCNDDSECPNGFRCQPADSLCIQGPGFDGAPSLSTDLLGPGRTLILTFVASESLPREGASAQLVEADAGAERTPVSHAFTQTAVDGRAYTFAVTDDPADPSGIYDVTVTLTNAAKQANVLHAGAVAVDNALPGIQPGAVLRRLPDTPLRGDTLVDVREDSEVEVTFATTEALAESPTVYARCGRNAAPPQVALERIGDTTSVFVFVYLSTDLSPLDDGACSLRADLTDTAGNVVEGAVILDPAFAMDQSPPVSPDVQSAGAIVYTRAPWGGMRDDGVGQKTFRVDGAAASLI